MISSVCFSRVDLGDFLSGTSVGHARWIAATFKAPCIGYHEIEVRIILNIAGNIVVIFNEFVESNSAITSAGLSFYESMMLFERLHELNEHLGLRLLARSDLWVG